MKQPESRPTSFRLSAALLDALKLAAAREHRSQTNMLEVMVRDYCSSHGVPVPDAAPRPSKKR